MWKNARQNDSKTPTPSSELSTCADVTLTSFAQLTALHTGMGRSFISLFDVNYQYIVAEASPSTPLSPSLPSNRCPEPLWLCGVGIPRIFGACEATLLCEEPNPREETITAASAELPLTMSGDLTVDNRFCFKLYCQPGSQARFYAAVPIQTRRGVNIGVICVMDETPNKHWKDSYTARLRELSRAVMNHLETMRLGQLHRRNERMNRGLGSFVEGETTISGWQLSPNAEAYMVNQNYEGALNARQQSLQSAEEVSESNQTTPSASPGPSPSVDGLPPRSPHGTPVAKQPPPQFTTASATRQTGTDSPVESYSPLETDPTPDARCKDLVFSRAANIVRESLEIEGCVFYRPKMSPFASRRWEYEETRPTDKVSASHSTSSSSGEEGTSPSSLETLSCQLLGFSTSEQSSIDGGLLSVPGVSLSNSFLSKLLSRYPKGTIFNFTADGELMSSDSSDEEVSLSASDASPNAKGASTVAVTGTGERKETIGTALSRTHLSRRSPRSREHEGMTLREAFPGARSVAFAPVWNSRKESWFAGCFAYTKLPDRMFTIQGELSYMRAFVIITAAEVHRLDTEFADQAKADALGSLSHELRSPLHGILLSAELLTDTNLEVYQGNLAHTIETCSRTLLDTIDHLLDFSQVNNFSSKGRAGMDGASTQGQNGRGSMHFGKKDLFSYVNIDGVAEEVVESVFAGFNFQHAALKQVSKGIGLARHSDVAAYQRLDSARALEQLGVGSGVGGVSCDFGSVMIFLSIDPHCEWMFYAHVGAVRRIIMNLFGNALKYTKTGTITVSLSQDIALVRRRRKEPVVKIVVHDTGKGMSKTFLETGLFKPFSQEDSIAPGTGLGLSLVKKITAQLNGRISIESQVGVGTTASVYLPLHRPQPGPDIDLVAMRSDEDQEFEELVRDIKGLRVRIVNSGWPTGEHAPSASSGSLDVICREWLQMEVVSDSAAQQAVPDIIIWSHGDLPNYSDNDEELGRHPNVVVCPNALVAYQRTMEIGSSHGSKLLDFISQP